jgi:hypothetical protein
VVFTAQEEGVSAAARKHGHARSTVQRLLRRPGQVAPSLPIRLFDATIVLPGLWGPRDCFPPREGDLW